MKLLRNLQLFVLLLSVSIVPAYTQCNPVSIITNVRPENYRFLHYYTFMNRFDSAFVKAEYGEFILNASGNQTRIYLDTLVKEFYPAKGDSVQGIDYTLRTLARSQPFLMPDSGEIKFYRALTATDDCAHSTPDSPLPNGDWRDNYWQVGEGRILDGQEFVIQLVKTSNGEVIGTIDSVGVLPNPTSEIVPRYGTDPTPFNHSHPLPTGFAGQEIYLRIQPKRWGTTPYGMSLYCSNVSDFSQAMITERDSTQIEILKCSTAQLTDLENQYFNEIISFCDSTKIATGWLPPNKIRFSFRNQDLAYYYNRYFNEYITSGGDTIYIERETINYKKAESPEQTSNINNPNPEIVIINIWPQPANSGELNLIMDLPDRESLNITIELSDLKGNFVNELWNDVLYRMSPIKLDISNIQNGMYLITFRNHSGDILASRKVMVAR